MLRTSAGLWIASDNQANTNSCAGVFNRDGHLLPTQRLTGRREPPREWNPLVADRENARRIAGRLPGSHRRAHLTRTCQWL